MSWSALRQAAIYNIYNCVYVCVGGWYRAVWGRVTEREWAEGECRGLKGAIIQQAQWALCAGGHSVTVGRGAGQRAAPCHNVFQHSAGEREEKRRCKTDSIDTPSRRSAFFKVLEAVSQFTCRMRFFIFIHPNIFKVFNILIIIDVSFCRV